MYPFHLILVKEWLAVFERLSENMLDQEIALKKVKLITLSSLVLKRRNSDFAITFVRLDIEQTTVDLERK